MYIPISLTLLCKFDSNSGCPITPSYSIPDQAMASGLTQASAW